MPEPRWYLEIWRRPLHLYHPGGRAITINRPPRQGVRRERSQSGQLQPIRAGATCSPRRPWPTVKTEQTAPQGWFGYAGAVDGEDCFDAANELMWTWLAAEAPRLRAPGILCAFLRLLVVQYRTCSNPCRTSWTAARLSASRRWSNRLEPQRAVSTCRRSRCAFALGAPSRRPFNCGRQGGC